MAGRKITFLCSDGCVPLILLPMYRTIIPALHGMYRGTAVNIYLTCFEFLQLHIEMTYKNFETLTNASIGLLTHTLIDHHIRSSYVYTLQLLCITKLIILCSQIFYKWERKVIL